mmetsp:Transcript_18710/g.70796  ORF Transcript_18710/g.70796 Transcript_18710/m.70796 type:complete len:93 (+) Transcript_18710:143-421(+)
MSQGLQPTVKAILILDQEGHRIAAKFFAPHFEHNQPACQRVIDSLAGKVAPSARSESDVLMVDGAIAIYRGYRRCLGDAHGKATCATSATSV